MNNDMKCPFCQQELVKDTPFAWNCPNEECVETDMMWGTANMWQELIRTHKALEIAVDALKDNLSQANFTQMLDASRFHCIRTKCELALEQITALEQKKSAFVHNKIEFPEYNDGLLEEFDKQFFENGQDDDLTETALEQKDK